MTSQQMAAPLRTDLQENSIGLIGATMQCVTHIAPAIAALFFTQFVVTQAGITAPLAYVVGFILVLLLGNTLAQLARHLPSAGGYYTYVSRAIGPRAGFLTAWSYILYSPVIAPVYGIFGFFVSTELKALYNIDIPWFWIVCVLAGPPIVAWIQHRGMTFSAQAMLVLGGLEMLVVFILALSGFASAPNGITLDVFNPGNISIVGFSGFFLAVVFSVQGLTGWEASAPLAEETTNPKRNVPWSIFLSITIIGIFLVFVFWGMLTGFGNDAQAIKDSEVLPALGLANKLWGAGSLIILFAFLNSVLAVGLATANVSTRMWYGMGRSGSLPKWFGTVHGTHKTPTNAILFQMGFSWILGLVGGFLFGPDVSFFFICGLILVLGVTVVYLMGNLAVFLFYWREKRSEFNWLLHAVFPLIATLLLVYATWASFVPNLPGDPYNWAPVIDGAWLLVGVGVLLWYRARGREEWLANAGKAIGEA